MHYGFGKKDFIVSPVVKNVSGDNIVVTGHFASNPVRQIKEIQTYSIIRNPIDRLISVSGYLRNSGFCTGLSDPEFERVLFSGELRWYGSSYPGFNWEPNMQTAYLCGVLVASRMPDPEAQRKEPAFNILRRPGSLEQVVDFLKSNSIKICSLERRDLIIDLMFENFFSSLDIDIREKNTNTNNEFDLKDSMEKLDYLEISESGFQRLLEQNELDFKLYNLVREHEKRNNSVFG